VQWQRCCNQSFKTYHQLYKRSREVHPETVSMYWSKCAKCGETFQGKNIVEQHQLLDYKNCYYCYLEFSTEDYMFKHARTTHFVQVSLNRLESLSDMCKNTTRMSNV
jgi:DNA-directed RNA polymerase subunit RPC12/RpoP